MALRTPKADVISRDSVDIRESSAQTGADAAWGPEVVLPGARFATDAIYLQQGDDLVLIGTDGSTFVVRGYFLLENPPDLVTLEGARLTPALVDSFTPPEATGQYAQAGQIAQAAEPIGQVKDITGKAFAVRTDGTRAPLSAGDPVYQGDVIETADGGAINMVFVDQTTFALGGDARLALDEMVYNPATQAGSSSFSIMKGVFVFVSGEIAKADNTKMQINTPVATIGIRGTKVAGEIKPAGEESKFTVIDGEIAVATQAGSVIMGDQNATTTVTSFSAVPTAPVVISQTEVNQSYSSVRSVSGGILNGGSQNEAAPETQAPQQPGDENPDGPQGPEQEAAAEGEAGAEEAAGEGEGAAEAEGEGTAEAEGTGGEGPGEEELGPVNTDEFAQGGAGFGGGPLGGPGDDFASLGGEFDGGFGTPGDFFGPGDFDGELDGFFDGGLPPPPPPDDPNNDFIEGEIFVLDDPIVDDRSTLGTPEFIPGGNNADTLTGGTGNDDIFGFQGDDTLTGNAGDDTISGGSGDDTLFGNAGNDFLIAGSGQGFDSYDGGAGTDTLSFASTSLGITADLTAGTASGAEIDSDTFVGIEVLVGGAGADILDGDAAANEIFGGGGNDIIDGFGGIDTIHGGAGDDLIGFDTSAETIDGGAGIDKIQLFGAGQSVNASNLVSVGSIEAVDLGGTGANTLSISSALVTSVSGTGTISAVGDGNDVVETADNWNLIGPVTQGTLTFDRFSDGGSTVDSATSIFRSAGTINFNAGAVLNNNLVNEGSLTTSNGIYTNDGQITLTAGGDMDMTGAKTLAGTGTFLNQQSLSLTDDTIATTLDGGIGTLGIDGTVTVDGVLIMGAGTVIDSAIPSLITGSGTLLNQGTQGIDDGSAFSVDSLVNQATLAFTTVTSTITSATIDNAAGAVMDFAFDTTVDLVSGQTLTNDGVTRLSGGADLSFLDGLISNTGTLDIVAAGSTLTVSNGAVEILAGSALTGAGTLNLVSSSLDVDTGVNLALGSAGTGPALEMTLTNLGGAGTFVNESEVIMDGASTLNIATFTNSNGGTLDHADGTLAVSSNFTNLANANLIVDTTLSNTEISFVNDFTNSGLIKFVGTNLGVISVGSGSGTLTNAASGTVQVLDGNNTLNGIVVSDGGMEVVGAAILNLGADFTSNAGSSVTVGDGTTTGELGGVGTLFNAGLLTLNNGTLSGNVDENSGSLNLQGAANVNSGVLEFNVDTTLFLSAVGDKLANSGTIGVNGSSTLTVDTGTLENLAAGTINVFGTGTIATTTGGVFSDSGTTTFGLSPGSLTIVGDMLRGDTAFMQIELGGLTPGIGGFDQFTVTGELNAGGTIDVVEFGGFEVSVGDSFAAINAGTMTNSFREISGLDVGGGVVLDATQSANGVVLTGRAVTHQGSASDDTLTGGTGDDVIVGGGGADFIVGGGGADLMHGGDGDDIFIAADTGFGRLDGEGGFDTVRFDGGGFDLTVLRGDQLSGIERFDITGTGDNTLTLGTEIALAATSGTNALTNVTDSLLIDGNAGDVVNAQGAWSNTGTVTIDGNGYSVFESGANGAQVFVDTDVSVNLV